MVLTEISQASCLGPGADLWVIPERKQSLIAQRLDWYLNFQIAKSSHHFTQEIPNKILELTQKCGLPLPLAAAQSRSALLLKSSQAFPNRWVLVIKGGYDFETWMGEVQRRWLAMNKPSLRIFLPTGISKTDLGKNWPPQEGTQDVVKVGFVVDT